MPWATPGKRRCSRQKAGPLPCPYHVTIRKKCNQTTKGESKRRGKRGPYISDMDRVLRGLQSPPLRCMTSQRHGAGIPAQNVLDAGPQLECKAGGSETI